MHCTINTAFSLLANIWFCSPLGPVAIDIFLFVNFYFISYGAGADTGFLEGGVQYELLMRVEPPVSQLGGMEGRCKLPHQMLYAFYALGNNDISHWAIKRGKWNAKHILKIF